MCGGVWGGDEPMSPFTSPLMSSNCEMASSRRASAEAPPHVSRMRTSTSLSMSGKMAAS